MHEAEPNSVGSTKQSEKFDKIQTRNTFAQRRKLNRFSPVKSQQNMSFDAIREKIAVSLDDQTHDSWSQILEDTTPDHYGIENFEFSLFSNDVWIVDIHKGTFTFRNGKLSFSARLGGSSDEDGDDSDCAKTVSGFGKFKFEPGNKIRVVEFEINEKPIDLWDWIRPRRQLSPA